jgi:hypothetical protein
MQSIYVLTLKLPFLSPVSEEAKPPAYGPFYIYYGHMPTTGSTKISQILKKNHPWPSASLAHEPVDGSKMRAIAES